MPKIQNTQKKGKVTLTKKDKENPEKSITGKAVYELFQVASNANETDKKYLCSIENCR